MQRFAAMYFFRMNGMKHSDSDDLFRKRGEELRKKSAPLADRMRPRTLEEYIGQQHIIGEGRLLRRAIQIDQLSSLIFYGPPGTGKTTLARIIATRSSTENRAVFGPDVETATITFVNSFRARRTTSRCPFVNGSNVPG